MSIAIRSATISDPGSPYHRKKCTVLIHNGRIKAINPRNLNASEEIEAKGMILSIGWFDLGTFVGDPGFEYKEDIESATHAASKGGFTEIAVLPNTHPAVQSKNAVHYLKKGNANRLVQIHPMACATQNHDGTDLTEMIDLNNAGAVAFTDGLKTLWNSDILLKSLQYLQIFDGLLINRPEDQSVTMHGQMNEGKSSIRLGLKGIPKVAEELATNRDIELLRYAGGRLHLTKLSTPKAVDLIRKGKKSGLNISCDIAAYQALLDDSLLEDFDTNYKVNPPLRAKPDLRALINGLRDDTIDILTSGHLPHEIESKETEFDKAEFGIINLETFASQIAMLSQSINMDQLIQKITIAPRKLLRMPVPTIAVGEKVNLTLFDPNEEWVFDKATNSSLSNNSPWLGKTIRGKVKATFNNGKYWIDD